MPNWFNRNLKVPKVPHSTFDMSNDYKSCIAFGELVPIYSEECVPSDKFLYVNQEVFCRLMPMTFPVLSNIHVRTHNFFVPMRIIVGDQNYEDFLQGSKDIVPLDISFGIETSSNNPGTCSASLRNSILDYLGIDVSPSAIERRSSTGGTIILHFQLDNPLPLFMYFRIVADWFLNETLQAQQFADYETYIDTYRQKFEAQQPYALSSGAFLSWLGTFKVNYSKDYFTSAQPQPTAGPEMYVLNRPLTVSPADGAVHSLSVNETGTVNYVVTGQPRTILNEETTIRDLWRKEQLVQYYQTDNLFGSRIREWLAGHAGVVMSDKRLMIPRYLGGSHSLIQVQEVLQTSATTATDPLGSFAGKASAYFKKPAKPWFCEEHGFYFSLLSLVPDLGYTQGNPRWAYKKNIFDFATHEFNNIGWQDIYKGEVLSDRSGGDNSVDLQTFGYQPRYSEYRAHRNIAVGNMRLSPYLGWHLNRNFLTMPGLNENFIKVFQSDINRIFNISDTSQNAKPVVVDCFNHVKMSRPISYEPDSLHIL